MWGITTYFNPARYLTKLRNLEQFAQRVRQQGLKLLIIELAFPEAPFAVPAHFADTLMQLRSGAVLWQKERLLNIAIARLPAMCDKVVWLDGDILFANNSWVEETSQLLEKHKVVQPFQLANWLPRVCPTQWDTDPAFLAALYKIPSMAYAMPRSPSPLQTLFRPDLAHPGFAWAARREILKACGLYDKGIAGGGDFFAMLAMYAGSAALAHPNVASCLSRHQASDLAQWANRFHNAVAGDVASTPGSVFHLWHGNLTDRQYIERYETLREFDFDPNSDIALDESGCWEWSSDKPDLHKRVEAYFKIRKEDG
jgi:hypothetical protein